jgi:hypothetical protein
MKAVEQFKTMGTWPVFLTSISTILGAILFFEIYNSLCDTMFVYASHPKLIQ